MDTKKVSDTFPTLKSSCAYSAKEIEEGLKRFEKLKNVLPNNVGIITDCKSSKEEIEEIHYKTVEISKLDLHDGDTILLTFNMDECDLETIQNITKLWVEALPNVNILSTVKPILDSVQIIRKEEDRPL